MLAVFDRAQIKRQRKRFSSSPSEHFFLFDWTIKQIEDRLEIVRRTFPSCVQIGTRGPQLSAHKLGIENTIVTDITGGDIEGGEDFFPFPQRSVDLIVSPLALHTVNDLPGALVQINQSLKPDGLFIAGMLGGETLRELRECLSEAELELSGGLTPRVAPFADKPQMGDLLQRAGFSLPVVDSEIITVTYESIFILMRDLRFMGEGNAIAQRSRKFTPRSLFLHAGKIYADKFAESDGRITATFEIIFLLGWAPHSSQQQALKPGSAKTRLADFLGTDEIGAGEKPN